MIQERVVLSANGARISFPVAINYYRWTYFRADIYNPVAAFPRTDAALEYAQELIHRLDRALTKYHTAWSSLDHWLENRAPSFEESHFRQLEQICETVQKAHSVLLLQLVKFS